MRAFVSQVRLYMRDFAELNRLLDGQETSDRQIAWAVLDALSNFNGTPPLIGTYSLEDLLAINQSHLLLRMTVETVIESVTLLQMRNHINASDGGINVGINDKAPMLQNWLKMSKSVTEQRKQHVKVALNIGQILGPCNPGVHSELWAVNSSYLAY